MSSGEEQNDLGGCRPCFSCCRWPIVPLCGPGTSSLWPADEDAWTDAHRFAAEVATDMLRSLSGNVYGLCHVKIRPCRRDCDPGLPGSNGFGFYPAVMFGSGHSLGSSDISTPVNLGGGVWLNAVCQQCGPSCSCTSLCELELPSPAHCVVEVKQDGQVIPEFEEREGRDGKQVKVRQWRVDGGNTLVRLDGKCWPTCQDMGRDDTEENTLSVRLLVGRPVPPTGIMAHTALATMLLKRCLDPQICGLPGNVTNVTREQVTYDLDANGLWAEHQAEVSAFLDIVNPGWRNGRRHPPTIWSPDFPVMRSQLMPWPGEETTPW